MSLVSLAALVALASSAFVTAAVAQPAFDPPPLPSGCAGGPKEPCALLDFTRRALAPALAGVTLAPAPGQPKLFTATSTDPALPAFRLMWIEEQSIAAEPAVVEFMKGLNQPDRSCTHRPHGHPTAIGQSFDVRCIGGKTPPVEVFLHVVPGRQRTTVLVLLAPLQNGPAVLARGERAAVALAQVAAATQAPLAAGLPPYAPPPNYAQLRADCADDADVARQIAGCEAVLANPDEQNNYAIAYNNRGHARERSGDTAAALADYDRAIKQEPTYAAAHTNRAHVLAQLGRTDEAITALDASIKIEDSGWARYERGRLLAAKGDRARALADLDEAVRQAPGDAEVRGERDRVRALLTAQAAPGTPAPAPAGNPLEAAVLGAGRPYVGEALLRGPLGPLPAGEALGAYTRELLAPGLPGLALTSLSASSPLAFRGEAPGLSGLIVRWWDLPGAGTAQIQMHAFERELNGSCNDSRMLAQRSGDGARVVAHAATCPSVAPPYQLFWFSASDRERSRLLLVAGPLAQGPAILATGDRIVAALGMTREPTPVASGSPASAPQASAPAATLADQPAPPAASLAEAALRAFGLWGGIDAETQARIERPAPDRARLEWDTMPTNGQPGYFMAQAPSCREVTVAEWANTGQKPLSTHVIDFDRLRGIVRRDGDGFIVSGEPYGQRVFAHQGQDTAVPVSGPGSRVGPSHSDYAWAETIMQAVAQFCPGERGAAQQQAAPTKPSEVRTARGLLRDKPFSLTYPADFIENSAGADLQISDAEYDLTVSLAISPSDPNVTAESMVRSFEAEIPDFVKGMQAQVPGFKLNRHTLLTLPAGQAQLVHWSKPQTGSLQGAHFIDVELFEGGRNYKLSFSVSEAAYEKRREAIGFILANFAPSAAARPCCADPIAIP